MGPPRDDLTCTQCGKTYARIDHLERHSRSHLHQKPFACATCGKAFARADALKRHERNHVTSPAQRRKASAAPRSRAEKACYSCATAKLKCDDTKPCSRCVAKGISCVSALGHTLRRTSLSSSTSGAAQELRRGYEDPAVQPQPQQQQQQLNRGPDDLFDVLPKHHVPRDHDLTPSAFHVPLLVHAVSHPATGPHGASLASGVPLHEQVQVSHFPPDPDTDMDHILGDSTLAEFLNDIMLPLTPTLDGPNPVDGTITPAHAQRDFLDFGTSWADFDEIEAMLATEEPGPAVRPNTNIITFAASVLPSGTKTPIFGDSFGLRNAAFSRSIWRWIPTQKDRGGADQLNLSLPEATVDSPETRNFGTTLLHGQIIDATTRDKILAVVLSTCDQSLYSDVVSAFPTAELLNGLLHYFLKTHFDQTDSWIHVPSLHIADQRIELVIAIIAAGAVLSASPAIRKLGFALQEAVRQAIANKFEEDNRNTRDLGCLQTMLLGLHIGLWSGDKRKMEIAESFLLPPTTMMRRGGRFSGGRRTVHPPAVGDADDTVREKWLEWVHAESFKRLALHVVIHDAQSSMSQQASPVLSPTEVTLELPASRLLWCASTPHEWRDQYLRIGPHGKGMTVAQSLSQIALVRDQAGIDVALSAYVIVHCIWALVWSHRQLNSLLRALGPGHSLPGSLMTSSAWDSGLPQFLEQVQLIFSDWHDEFRPELALVLDRTLLNLHVSFEQVQLFAGKDGEEEARRVFPLLKAWASSSDARKAVWHAGQVLRAASRCLPNHLRDFQAVCLYHAGMAFWSYAIVSAFEPDASPQAAEGHSTLHEADLVWLDGDGGPAVQRFIALNRGTPVVSGNLTLPTEADRVPSISLTNPKAIMDICIALLQRNAPAEGDGTQLPLVENLTQLMRDLGHAAQGLLQVGSRRTQGASRH